MSEKGPPKPKKIKCDEYGVSESEKRARAAWRESPSRKIVQKHSVYAVILRTITWLEGLHSQAILKAADTQDSEALILRLEFKVCSNEHSLYRKLLIQMGDPNGSTKNRSPAQNPEKTFNNFLKLDFDSEEKFIAENFTPFAAHTLIQRYCRKVYYSYSSKDFAYIKNTHPIDHPGVKDLFRFLPPEIDVCSFVNLKFSDMERTAQRSQIPKYNVAKMNLEKYVPLPPISVQMVAKSTFSRELAKITDKKRSLKKSGDSEEAEKLNVLQSKVTLEMVIKHQTENGCVFANSTLFPVCETQTIPGYALPITATIMSIMGKIALGGPALFAHTLNQSMKTDKSLNSIGIQFFSEAFLDKSASVYKFTFDRYETSVVGSANWDKNVFSKQTEMSLADISAKNYKMLVVNNSNRSVYAIMMILYYHRQVAAMYKDNPLIGESQSARCLGILLMEMYLTTHENRHEILWNFVLTYCAAWLSLIHAGDPLVACKSTEQLYIFCNMIFYQHTYDSTKIDHQDMIERYCEIFDVTNEEFTTIYEYFHSDKNLIDCGFEAMERYFNYMNPNQNRMIWQQLVGRNTFETICNVEVEEILETETSNEASQIESENEPVEHEVEYLDDTYEEIEVTGDGGAVEIDQPACERNRIEESRADQDSLEQAIINIEWENVKLPRVPGEKREIMDIYDGDVPMNDTFTDQFNKRDPDICVLKCRNNKKTNDPHKNSTSKDCEYCLRTTYRCCDEYLWLPDRFDKCFDCVSSYTKIKATKKRNWATYINIRKQPNKPYIRPSTYARVVEQVNEKGLQSLEFKKSKIASETSPTTTMEASINNVLVEQNNVQMPPIDDPNVEQNQDGDSINADDNLLAQEPQNHASRTETETEYINREFE